MDSEMQDLVSSVKARAHYLRESLGEQIKQAFNLPDLTLTDDTLRNIEGVTLILAREEDVDSEDWDYAAMRDEAIANARDAMPAIRYVVTSRFTAQEIAALAASSPVKLGQITTVTRYCEVDKSPDPKSYLMRDFDALEIPEQDRDIFYVFRLVLAW